jgi:hypothetical protein
MANIPASTVLLVAAGGVLVYAGFTSQNPLAALKSVSSGKPTSVRDQPGIDSASFVSTSGGGIASVAYANVGTGGGLPSLPRACEQFAGDRYSKAMRWANGYSDCSSFVGKGLKLIGVKPPAGSTTGSYLASREWKQVPASSVQAGDLAIAMNHVVVCYGSGYGIGQQNPRSNVQKGTVDSLMIGNKPYIYLRYTPGGVSTSGKSTGTTTQPKSAMA